MEEDKKRAEQEGMALQGRKGKAEDLTITINKCANVSEVTAQKNTDPLLFTSKPHASIVTSEVWKASA